MKRSHLVLLVLMNCLWAASYSAFKALAPALDAGGVATLRYALAGMVLVLCWRWLPGPAPRGRDLARAAVMGVLVFAFSPRLQVAGVQMGRAADASVLVALEPLVVSVGAAIFLREHIGLRRWIGFILGLVGVGALADVGRPDFRWPALISNLLILLSFFCEAAYSIMGKPLLNRAGLFKVLAVAIIAGTVANLLMGGPSILRAAAALPVRAWLILAYLALICTLAGYSLWFVVIRETQVNNAALTVFIQPVAGTVIAMAWLGEALHWGQLWGSLVIMAGLAVGLSREIYSSGATGARRAHRLKRNRDYEGMLKGRPGEDI
ncbi:MAG: EamA family transporter [Verrucomicrobiota bacterium]|nr:EamA family transporter [Verrucomicrobiota bacterium]